MPKDPAVLFYTADYLTGTRLMTYEQKGKYMDLLCLQHQQGPLTEQDMLAVCEGYDERIFSKFVIDENGRYYNARMEEERIKREKFCQVRRENGSKGGRPRNLQVSCRKATVNLGENENININKTVIVDESTSKDLPSTTDSNKYLDRFAKFWAAYPRKVGKGAAEKAFMKIRPSEELLGVMLRAIERQKLSEQWVRQCGQFIPHPTTWLNQERWRDEPPGDPPERAAEREREEIEEARRNGWDV